MTISCQWIKIWIYWNEKGLPPSFAKVHSEPRLFFILSYIHIIDELMNLSDKDRQHIW